MTHLPQGPTRADLLAALDHVYDGCCAERKISIVDLGLVDEAEVCDGHARVRLVLTTGWCPFSGAMMGEAEQRLRSLDGIDDVTIDVRWDKIWGRSRMAPGIAERLRLLPEPGEVVDRDGFVAAARVTSGGLNR